MRLEPTAKIGLIILAAGGSSRLGQPKQKLPFKNSNLLQHATQVAIDSGCRPIVIVLGAAFSEIKASLGNLPLTVPVEIVENPHWLEGMASSIKTAILKIKELSPDLAGVILMVCDQPYVTPHLLRNMKREWLKTGKGIVACSYAGTVGTPALFAKDYFEDLLALEGQEGAKKILIAYQSFLTLIPFPLGQVDIDTPEDYNNLSNSSPTFY